MTARILYIEDNPLNMRLVRKLLHNMGYEMIEAMDGQTGIKMVEKHQPDLVLVDVNLPDIDGLEVTRRLKQDAACARIPFVALTANVMHGDRERCLAAGCDGYLAKPVARLELQNTLQYFLERDPAAYASVR
jgi:two-component system cell cycle response regulator DivK